MEEDGETSHRKEPPVGSPTYSWGQRGQRGHGGGLPTILLQSQCVGGQML